MPVDVTGGESAGELLLRAVAMVPPERYVVAFLVVVSVILYRFLELHVIGDLLRGFRGGRVELTFHPASEIYHRVVSKCRSLHGRYACGFYCHDRRLVIWVLVLGIHYLAPTITW
jgi:uncharacterized protein